MAVTTQFSNNYPLQLFPGETIDIFFKIQNVFEEGGQDLTIEVIPGDSEIAVFEDNDLTYELPLGESINVPVEITIPEGDAEGTKYTVGALFKSVSGQEGGIVGFVTNLGKSFPVVVVEEPKESPEAAYSYVRSIWLVIVSGLILGILAVLILIMYFVRKQRRSQVNKLAMDSTVQTGIEL